MLKVTTDVLPLVKLPSDRVVISGDGDAKVEHFSLFNVTHKRGYCVGLLGVLPTCICPVLERILPWYCTDGIAANFAQIVTTAVYQRLATLTHRFDVISKLIQGKDDEGRPMGSPELAGETIGYLNAGTGTNTK